MSLVKPGEGQYTYSYLHESRKRSLRSISHTTVINIFRTAKRHNHNQHTEHQRRPATRHGAEQAVARVDFKYKQAQEAANYLLCDLHAAK